ncbi:hypothetical protein [Pseudophaeobacter sp. A-200-2]|uniref:hypothetical protein n=1 Tax=Pseudophaeobacter sp. A-200-2 TaxID=3098145 RepID=UPI0034D78A0D
MNDIVSPAATDDDFVSKVSALHLELFPEEYDFMLDSGVDLKIRRQGGSPMSDDYLKPVNLRRARLGVPEISGAEATLSADSWDFCMEKVFAQSSG